MNAEKCKIHIGTSGWHYSHWQGKFYPSGLPKTRWLNFYAQHFDTVEINNTFYQLPKEQTFINWHDQAPKKFIFAVKANRYITHLKRLKNVAEPLSLFLERAALLKENLGPILYQLPPNYHKNLEILESFIALLPRKQISVFEFRHQSWFARDTYKLLDKAGIAFCTHDMPGNMSPAIVTGKNLYIRFHSPSDARYHGNYPDSILKDWAKWINNHRADVRHIFAYFNNDIEGYAIKNAQTLRNILD